MSGRRQGYKTLIIVDTDVNPYDWDEVDWALSARFDPVQDVEVLTGLPGNPVDPSMPPEAAERSSVISKIAMDATKSIVNPLRSACLPRHDVMEKVREGWARYGTGSSSVREPEIERGASLRCADRSDGP